MAGREAGLKSRIMSTTTRIVKLGADGGMRVPQALLKAADLGERVNVRVEPGRLVVTAVESDQQARRGWADAARAMRALGDDRLLDSPQATSFDDQEWEW